MLYFKRLLLLILGITTVVVMSNHVVYASPFTSQAAAYGFNISEDYDGYTTILQTDYYYYEQSTLNHFTRVNEVLAYNTQVNNIYGYMYKVITEPYQVRNWGFLGIGSHSDNWRQHEVDVNVYLLNYPGEILQWAPENNPSIYTTNIGVGYGTSGFELSAGVSYNHSELTISNTSSYFYKNYRVKHSFNYSYNSTYVNNTVSSYGMFLFDTETTQNPGLMIMMDIRYFGSAWYGAYSSQGHKYHERFI